MNNTGTTNSRWHGLIALGTHMKKEIIQSEELRRILRVRISVHWKHFRQNRKVGKSQWKAHSEKSALTRVARAEAIEKIKSERQAREESVAPTHNVDARFRSLGQSLDQVENYQMAWVREVTQPDLCLREIQIIVDNFMKYFASLFLHWMI